MRRAAGRGGDHDEQVPGAAIMLAELATEAGLPPGVLNIVNGANSVVDNICDHPVSRLPCRLVWCARQTPPRVFDIVQDIRAISFVGSSRVGMHVYTRGTRTGKRVQSNMGAKNHAVVMPDANRDQVVNALTGAAFGAAGCDFFFFFPSPPLRSSLSLPLAPGIEQASDVWPSRRPSL